MKNTIVGVVSCSLSAGCAVGYGIGTTSHSATATSDAKTSILEKDKPIKFSTAYQEFRIIDTTGILLALFVNAGRQSEARQEAIENAAYKEPDANGKVQVEYSWEPMPILAGLLTDMRFRIPLGTVDGEVPTGTDVKTGSTGYWGLSLRPEFYTFRPVKSQPIVASLWFDAAFEVFHGKTADDIEDADLDEIDMGFGTSVSYVPRENVTTTARVGLGVLSPLFGLIDGGSKFNPYGEIEVAYRPWHAGKYGFQIGATAGGGRVHATSRSATYDRLGINVAVTFGDQVREHTRTSTTPSAPGETEHLDPSSSVSGNICVGKRVPDSCQVKDKLPQGEQLVYVLCAKATVDAANSSDFSTQPSVCRNAAAALLKSAQHGTHSDEERRNIYIAAATAFDFAGAGYEVTSGRLGADHCAMVQAVSLSVIGGDRTHAALPTKLTLTDEAVEACRAKSYQCQPDDTLGIVCSAAVAPAAPPAPSVPTDGPTLTPTTTAPR